MSANPVATGNDYTIATDVKNTIMYIGKTFIDSKQSTIYLGNLDNRSLADKKDMELNFVEALIKGYPSFKTRFSNSLPQNITQETILMIMTRTLGDKKYTPISNDTVISPKNTEINFSKLLIPSSDLLSILDKIKNVYTFLEDNTLIKYTIKTMCRM
jgi:hypothetical protein